MAGRPSKATDQLTVVGAAEVLVCAICGKPKPGDGSPCPDDGSRSFIDAAVTEWDSRTPTRPGIDPLLGSMLGEYQVLERIGAGGMGIVYRGFHPVIKKTVAIKVLKPELAGDQKQMDRVLIEAQTVNAVRHRSIIDIFGFGTVSDGRKYVVMEYLDGESLDEVLKTKKRFTPLEAVDLLLDICGPLASAHKVGVVHRDLKPSNIFLVKDGDGSRFVKVLDFGLAKQTSANAPSSQTSAQQVFGTPNYMAPELCRDRSSGAKSDLYALGVMMYEFLTGEVPFKAETAIEVMMAHVSAPIPLPSRLNSAVPEVLDALVVRLLSKAPEDRPESAELLKKELKEIRATFDAPRRLSDDSMVRVEVTQPPRKWVGPAIIATLAIGSGGTYALISAFAPAKAPVVQTTPVVPVAVPVAPQKPPDPVEPEPTVIEVPPEKVVDVPKVVEKDPLLKVAPKPKPKGDVRKELLDELERARVALAASPRRGEIEIQANAMLKQYAKDADGTNEARMRERLNVLKKWNPNTWEP